MESGHGNSERAGRDCGGVGKARGAWDGGRDRGREPARDGGPAGLQHRRASPFDQVEWELRTAEIKDERGRIIFQQTDCEIPRNWSQLATNVVVSKYFYGDVASGNGSPATGKREYLGSPVDRSSDADDRRLGKG